MIRSFYRATSSMRAISRQLRRDERGLAFIEFAYMLPVLMSLGLGGIELANLAITHTRVSQLALSLADNASRAKQEVASGLPRMREIDVNQVLKATTLQSGRVQLDGHGRVILSSLETNAEGGQWIHWQRCAGGLTSFTSAYGPQGKGATGTAFNGMGPAGRRVKAEPGYAIMFVEIAYDYQPMIFGKLIPDRRISKSAAMYVRDNRDLSRLYNDAPVAPVSSC